MDTVHDTRNLGSVLLLRINKTVYCVTFKDKNINLGSGTLVFVPIWLKMGGMSYLVACSQVMTVFMNGDI